MLPLVFRWLNAQSLVGGSLGRLHGAALLRKYVTGES